MANQENGAGQEPQPNADQQGQEPSDQQNPEGQESEENGPKGFDPDTIQDPAVKAYLEKVRKDVQKDRQEAARYRTERNALQQKVTEMERAGETEDEKAQRERQERDARLERLEAENRDLKVGAVVRDEATKAKAHNPARVWGLIKDQVETDDDGQPVNVADLLADLKRTDPYLFRRTEGDAGAGKGGESSPSGDMNHAIRRMAGRA